MFVRTSKTFRQEDDQIINRDRVSRRHGIVRKESWFEVGKSRTTERVKTHVDSVFGVDSEPLCMKAFLESGSLLFFWFLIILIIFLDREVDPARRVYHRVETGRRRLRQMRRHSQISVEYVEYEYWKRKKRYYLFGTWMRHINTHIISNGNYVDDQCAI